jgi:tricorn protease-like protein
VREVIKIPQRHVGSLFAICSRKRLTGSRATRRGVRRYLRQSIAFWAAAGPALAEEETPLAFDASPAVGADARVLTELEHRLLGNPNLEGIALRYGFFYGPAPGSAPMGCCPTSTTATIPDRREWRRHLVVVAH